MVTPIANRIMPFGKMKGEPLGRVFHDYDYMEVLASCPSPGRPIKYILKLFEEYLKEEYEYWDSRPDEVIEKRGNEMFRRTKKLLWIRPGARYGRYYYHEEKLCKRCKEWGRDCECL
jgi:hypothetical protein